MAFVKISPKDVRQRQFKKGFTGYDPEEVGAYMKAVAAELERQIEQNARLSELIADLEKKLTVLKVKKIFGGKEKGEDLPPEIKKDVEQILAEAKAKSEEMVSAAKAESDALRTKIKEDTAKEFEKLGYSIVIYPVTTLRLAMKAVTEGLAAIKREGGQEKLLDQMQTRAELYELLRYREYGEFDARIADFSLPKSSRRRQRI